MTDVDEVLGEIREALTQGWEWDGGDSLGAAVVKLLALPVDVIEARVNRLAETEVTPIPVAHGAILLMRTGADVEPDDVAMIATELIGRYPGCTVVSLGDDGDLSALDDEGMRAAGWVRAET